MENTYQTTQGQSLQDIAAKTGFSINDLMAKNKGLSQTGTYGTGVNIALPEPKVSTTTISNENKIGQAYDLKNQAQTLSQNRGMVTDGEIKKYADGSVFQDNYQEPQIPPNSSPIYGTVNGQPNRIIGYNQSDVISGIQTPVYFDSNSSTPLASPEEKMFNDTLASMKSLTDARTARTIASIESKYKTLKDQQRQINEGQSAGIKNALLTGGVTGKGSSAQYAPISSEGIVAAQLNYGVQKMAELDAKELELINEAQSAGDEQNFQLLEKKLAQVEKVREEKHAEAKELSKKIEEENAKAREQLRASARDTAVAEAFALADGQISAGEILRQLNAQGGDFTAKEVNDAIKNMGDDISKPKQEIAMKLAQYGADPTIIQKVLSAKSVNEAISLASGSLQDPKAQYELESIRLNNVLTREKIAAQQKATRLLGEPSASEKKEINAAVKEAKASVPVMQDKIAAVDVLLKNKGLQSRVGTSIQTRTPRDAFGVVGKVLTGVGIPSLGGDITDKLTGAGQDFAGGVHKLTSGLSLDTLIEAKKRGATFGALSDSELRILSAAASAINDWEIKDDNGKPTGIWDIDEKSFKRELKTIQDLTKRALEQAQGTLVDPSEQSLLDEVFNEDKEVDASSYFN